MKYEIGTKRLYNECFPDQEVVLWDVLNIKEEQELLFSFISTNSKYVQGVRLAIDAGEGYIEINSQKNKSFHIWETTCPKKVHIKCVSKKGLLSVYNIYDLGESVGGRPGGVRSLGGYSGMLIENNNNIITYKCNDVGFETNFDKLIFQIELL